MLRFVDLTQAYWLDPEDAQPCCAFVNTVTDKFLTDDMGCHVLNDLGEVREAGGDRAVGLVPVGFFERKTTDLRPEVLERAAEVLTALGEHRIADQVQEVSYRLEECLFEGKGYRP